MCELPVLLCGNTLQKIASSQISFCSLPTDDPRAPNKVTVALTSCWNTTERDLERFAALGKSGAGVTHSTGEIWLSTFWAPPSPPKCIINCTPLTGTAMQHKQAHKEACTQAGRQPGATQQPQLPLSLSVPLPSPSSCCCGLLPQQGNLLALVDGGCGAQVQPPHPAPSHSEARSH